MIAAQTALTLRTSTNLDISAGTLFTSVFSSPSSTSSSTAELLTGVGAGYAGVDSLSLGSS